MKRFISIALCLLLAFTMSLPVFALEDPPGGDPDTTPPAFAPGYPKAGNMQIPGSRQVRLTINAQEEAYHYCVVLPNGAAAPSKEQVVLGQDAGGNPALKTMKSGNSKYEGIDTGTYVPLHNTEYDIYVVLKDDAGNLSEPAKVDVTSPAAADLLVSGYPRAGTVQPDGSKQVQIQVKVQNVGDGKKGRVYWVLLPDGATSPSIEQIADGTDGGGNAAIAAESPEFAPGNEGNFLVTGIAGGTNYDLYMVVGDTQYAGPLAHCTDVVKLDVTTPVDLPGEKVCAIGSTEYGTLAEALTEAGPTATIKLLKSFTSVQAVSINNKNITFDLSGKILTIATTSNEGLKVAEGTVALTGEGELNVSGKLYGVWANKSTVTVTDATATDTDTSGSASGMGVYAIGGSKVTVRGDAAGAAHGVRAENLFTEVTVNGNVSNAGQIKGAVYSAGQAQVTVKGNVTATSGYGVHAYGGGSITVEKDVSGNHIGAFAEDVAAEIIIKGNLISGNNGAVIGYTLGSGSITVDGEIKGYGATPVPAVAYVTINGTQLAKTAGVPDPEKTGYLKYSTSGIAGAVWVKDASDVITVSNATELKAALGSVVGGGTIRLTANIDYAEKIVVDAKSFTLNVGAFTLNLNVSAPGSTVNALELKNGGDLALTGTGQFNINLTGGNASSGVYANAGSLVTVSSIKVNVASGSAFGVYAYGAGSKITVLGDVEVTGTEGGCGAKTWSTGEIHIDGIMTAPIYINLNSVSKAKDSGEVDGSYLKYSAVKDGPGIVWVKIAPPVCQIEDASGNLVQQYDNLPEALTAAIDGQYIRLLQNIIYEKSVDGNSAIKISGAKTIYLQMNDHDLTICNTGNGSALEVGTNSKVWVGETGNLTLDAKFAALNVSYGEFHSGGAVNAMLRSALNTGINADHATVDIEKGTLIGVAGGIYAGGSSTIAFNGPITVNGQPAWESHGVHLSGTGNTVSVNGNIHIASGLGTGVYVQDGGTVIVGHTENPVSITSTNSAGIWTRQGSNLAEVIVYGDVTAKARAIDATGDADIKVFGNVKSTSTVASVFAVEGFANSGDTITIAITGNVEGQNGTKYHGNGGTISVTGNVTATGSAGDTVGVFASYGSVSVTGNVAAPNGIGAEAGENGEITINGVLTGNTYVKVYYVPKMEDDKEPETTKAGYHTYKKDSAVVWIKDGAPATAYPLTVQNGTGGGSYLPGMPVNITANPPIEGKVFDRWVTSGGGTFNSATSATTTFTMPAAPVTVTATYKNAPVDTYDVTVSGSYASSTGAGSYQAAQTVTIHAGSRSGYTFTGWTSTDGVTFANADSATTTFTMPAKNVTVKATWRSNGGNSSSTVPKKPSYEANVSDDESTAQIPVTIKGETGAAAELSASQSNGLATSGGNTTIDMPSIPGVKSYTITLPAQNLNSAKAAGTLTLTCSAGNVTVPSNMLTGIQDASDSPDTQGMKAALTISQAEVKNLTKEAQALIGHRPLIQLTLSLDGRRIAWNNPDAPVTVSIPYTPTAEELQNPESILIWYIDGNGNAVSVPNGRYDSATGKVTFKTTHFSYYGIGFNEISFDDVAESSWYNEAVSFMAARKITIGTDDQHFNPNAKVTRGQLIVMLMRAYGITPDANPTDNFADAGDNYYTNYLATAKRLGIAKGIGDNLFAPEKYVTRQEMFTLLYNALTAIDQLPGSNSGKALSDFADAGQIAPWAKDATEWLIKTGAVYGNGGNLSPASTATRAETAQVLYNLLPK